MFKLPSASRTERPLGRSLLALRVVLAAALVAGSLASAPAAALASRLPTDRIAGVPLSAGEVPESAAPDISARAGALVAPGGRVLWTRSSESRRPMASTTKIMTALVILENCRLDEAVRITSAADRTPYGTGLRTGEKRSVRMLLELLLVASSNDAATALAIHEGGSVSGFANRMNTRAKQLGLTNTYFKNPHGLDASGHFSSATDLNRLMRVALGQAEFKRIIRMRSVVQPRYRTRPARRIKNTNALLGEVEGLLGGKTGFTNDARYCLIATTRRDGVTLTTSILGSSSSSARFASSKRLIEWGFKHYRLRQVCSASQVVGAVPVSANVHHVVSARCAKSLLIPVFDLAGPVTRVVSLDSSVTVPVFAGQRLGTVRFVQDGAVLAAVDAVAVSPKASAEETVGTVPVTGYVDRFVVARAAPSAAAVAAFDTSRPVERLVSLDTSVAAPVFAGQLLGSITYRQDGRVLVTVPAVAAESVEAPPAL